MGLLDRIQKQAAESASIQQGFISLKNILIYLKNMNPQVGFKSLAESLEAEYLDLVEKPRLHFFADGHLKLVELNDSTLELNTTKNVRCEPVGQGMYNTLHHVLQMVEKDSLNAEELEEYGFLNFEISTAFGIQFPTDQCNEIDYLKALAEKDARIYELEEILKQLEPHKNAERHATKREDVLSAEISLLNHPEFYVRQGDMTKNEWKKRCKLIQDHLPGARALADLLSSKCGLFWPGFDNPPLGDDAVYRLNLTAIKRVDNAK
ncbi:hypothetical protein [Buttiauxella noackiae]|uniref:hypothetical protein n=1 Tax=Buttiauxella noackiae TaxID=82992 RepID=UPI0005572509|nr:hypothetical protein [Buttiauxella noackiae]